MKSRLLKTRCSQRIEISVKVFTSYLESDEWLKLFLKNCLDFEVENHYHEHILYTLELFITFIKLVSSAFVRTVWGCGSDFLWNFRCMVQLFYVALSDTTIEVCVCIY